MAPLPVARAWAEAVAGWQRQRAASGATAATLAIRRKQLYRLSRQIGPDPWATTRDQLLEYIGTPGLRPETRKSYRFAIQSFFRWAAAEGHVAIDPSAQLPVVRVPPSMPRPAPEDVLATALAGCDRRVRLMLLLAATAGLRRNEIACLYADDVGRDRDQAWLRIRGKGGRMRHVPISLALARELETAAIQGPVFPGQIDGHLSASHVGKVIKCALGQGWTAHTLRHRFATMCYAADRDLLAVQTLLGHSKPETTARYTAIPEGALQAAVTNAGRVAEPAG